MPAQDRHKTQYKGVYYIIGKTSKEKQEKIYYISYYRGGKKKDEKAGRQFQDNMTPAKANNIRSLRITGKEPSNKEQRNLLRETNPDAWTFQRLWAEYKSSKGLYAMLKTDESLFNLHLAPYFANKQPSEIVPLDIERLIKNLSKKEGRIKGKALSKQTIKHCLGLLKRLANFKTKMGYGAGLSFIIQMPKVNNEVEENLSPSQIKSLLDTLNQCEPTNITAWLMRVMLFTGRRTGEMFKLEWKDVDLETQTMRLEETKSGRTEITPFCNEVKLIFEKIPHFSDRYIFPNLDGSRRQSCKKASKTIKLNAGLPTSIRSTYCLRHTFASIGASCGVPYHHIKELLGHSSAKSEITARYAHVSKTALLDSANIIAQEIIQLQPKLDFLKKTYK